MSQNNNPFIKAFDGFQFPGDWDGDDIAMLASTKLDPAAEADILAAYEALGKQIADDAVAGDGYFEVDEDGEFIAVHEAKYARRDAKAARAAFAAKVRKGGK